MPTRILLAESDDLLRASLAEQLVREGYEVMAASNGEDARSLARALNAIQIPAEHAWTDVEGQLWWSQLRLTKQKADVETERLLVPNRASTHIEQSASGSDARTIEARPSARTVS